MPRPKRCRFIDRLPVYRSFSPDDIDASESVLMTVDEFETLRLLDNEGLTQKQCAARMNVSRTTVTAIYDSARKKIGDVLVNGKRLLMQLQIHSTAATRKLDRERTKHHENCSNL